MKSGSLILSIGIVAAIGAVGFFLLKAPSEPVPAAIQTVEETPRTDAPMEELTRFIPKRSLRSPQSSKSASSLITGSSRRASLIRKG